jgi:hypothetical protein
MPKNFLVQATINVPYPKHYEARVVGTNIGVALGRGWREIRKDIKGRRIKEIVVRVISLG